MPLVAPREITFEAYEDEDGGYYAAAEGFDIITQGDDWDELKKMVQEATVCHFGDGIMPETIKLHLIKQEVIAV